MKKAVKDTIRLLIAIVAATALVVGSDILPRFIEAGASSCEAGSRFSFDSTNVLSISELSPCVPRFYCWITRSLTASPHF